MRSRKVEFVVKNRAVSFNCYELNLFRRFREMIAELRDILHEAYTRERKLNLLYGKVAELDSQATQSAFLQRAQSDQQQNLKMLDRIASRYGEQHIDPGVLEKIGESLLSLRAGHKEREELVRQILEFETELVEIYKRSLRYLSSDDESRKLINRILTVKLGHRRDLMGELGFL